MTQIFISLVVLSLIRRSICELSLQINKKNNDVIHPVTNKVEEKVGTTFSLVCELVSATNNSTQFDDQLTWIKGDKTLPNQPRFLSSDPSYSITENIIREMNKLEKIFNPLQAEDRGIYYCISYKFRQYKFVEVIVRDDIRRPVEPRQMRESYCGDYGFKCLSSMICIAHHFVCDGKQDCTDGSDESIERCGTDACKGKIPCEDRCIPAGWCCDKHHDPNCTVLSKPRCCPYLSDPYEEMELGLPPSTTQMQHSGAKYLFVSVCIVSILFSVVLLLLIVSRVVIFAKKAALQQQRHNLCENIALRNQTNVNIIPCDIYTYRHSRTPRPNIVRNIIIDSSDVNDPLLFNPARFNVINAGNMFDQPPSYVDVLRTNRLVNEPPPPYRSSEMLDLTGDRTERNLTDDRIDRREASNNRS